MGSIIYNLDTDEITWISDRNHDYYQCKDNDRLEITRLCYFHSDDLRDTTIFSRLFTRLSGSGAIRYCERCDSVYGKPNTVCNTCNSELRKISLLKCFNLRKDEKVGAKALYIIGDAWRKGLVLPITDKQEVENEVQTYLIRVAAKGGFDKAILDYWDYRADRQFWDLAQISPDSKHSAEARKREEKFAEEIMKENQKQE